MTSVVTVNYTMTAVDSEPGDAITACFVGEGKDSGDKATSKALAMAYKYFALQFFIIPLSGQQVYGDDAPQVDADATDPEPSAPAPKAAKSVGYAGLKFEDLLDLINGCTDLKELEGNIKKTLTSFTSHANFKETIPAAYRAKQAALKESK
jgi:hypothetical protein